MSDTISGLFGIPSSPRPAFDGCFDVPSSPQRYALGGCFDVPSSPQHSAFGGFLGIPSSPQRYALGGLPEDRFPQQSPLPAFDVLLGFPSSPQRPSHDEFYRGFMNVEYVVVQYLPFMGVNATSVASTPEPRSVSSLSSVSTQTTSDAGTQTDAPPTATVLPPKSKAVKRTQLEDAAPAAAPKPKRRR
jgi:hypothetical protein